MYLAGLILDITSIQDKYTLLTLDDGSGATVEVKITHVLQERNSNDNRSELNANQNSTEIDTFTDTDEAFFDTFKSRPYVRTKTFKTQTPGLTVTHHPPASPEDSVTLTLVSNAETTHNLKMGSLLKAKGSLSIYRNTFQLTLLRAVPLLNVDADVAVWEDYADFVNRVLCRPWMLSASEICALEIREEQRLKALEDAEQQRRDEEMTKKAKRRRREEQYKRRLEKEQARQAVDEERFNGNPLDRSRIATNAMPISRPKTKHRPQAPILQPSAVPSATSRKATAHAPTVVHPRITQLGGKSKLRPQAPTLGHAAIGPISNDG